MSRNSLDLKALFSHSMQLFKRHASFLIGISSIFFVLVIVPRMYVMLTAGPEPDAQMQLTTFIILILHLYLSFGILKTIYFLADGRPVSMGDLASGLSDYLSYSVGYFMYLIAVGIGLILFIIPGIYLAIRLQFFPYYVIDDSDTSFYALKKSWDETAGFEIDLFLFGVCVMGINIVGALLFGVGFILAYPFTTAATALAYLQLSNRGQIPNVE